MNSLFHLQRNLLKSHLELSLLTLCRNYAKPTGSPIPSLGKAMKKGKGAVGSVGPSIQKRKLPVETDTKRLATYLCGSNLNEEGEDIKLGEDSEYPDWLWKLHIGPPKTLNDLDPETDEYWELLKKLDNIEAKKLLSLKKF